MGKLCGEFGRSFRFTGKTEGHSGQTGRGKRREKDHIFLGIILMLFCPLRTVFLLYYRRISDIYEKIHDQAEMRAQRVQNTKIQNIEIIKK